MGSARTALFNWLYAKHTGGELFLRIEDTNAELNEPGLVENIIASLDWLGITFSGDPIRQSERRALYDDAIDGWLAAKLAYHSDGAVWFEMPKEGVTEFEDVIRGHVQFDNAKLEDFVVRRSDGSPTFVVANSVDDLDLGITHIIRGEDMLNITPQGLTLRQALGETTAPVYAHLPLIVNEQKKKLSKRRDDVSVRDFRAQGVLPQALVNYLALLGWGPPDNIEVRPIEEIAELFKLENVGAAAAVFDMTKLQAINATYLRALSPAEFAAAIEPWVRQTDWGSSADISDGTSGGISAGASGDASDVLLDRLTQLAPLIQERTKLLTEAPAQLSFFFSDNLETDEAAWAKVTQDAQQSKTILGLALAAYGELDWPTSPAVLPASDTAANDTAASATAFTDQAHQLLRDIADSLDIKLRIAQLPVRVALTGRTVGPPLFESMMLLGPDVTLQRLDAALQRLDAAPPRLPE